MAVLARQSARGAKARRPRDERDHRRGRGHDRHRGRGVDAAAGDSHSGGRRGPARVGLRATSAGFSALPDASFAESPALAALAATALAQPMRDPPWQDAAFEERFGESWRRLMVRLAVASQLAEARSLVRAPELRTATPRRGRRGVPVSGGREDRPRATAHRGHAPACGAARHCPRSHRRAGQALRGSPGRRSRDRQPDSEAGRRRRGHEIARARCAVRLDGHRPAPVIDRRGRATGRARGDRGNGRPDGVRGGAGRDPQAADSVEGYHALRALETLAPVLQRPSAQNWSVRSTRGGARASGRTARAALADRVLASVAHDSAPSI